MKKFLNIQSCFHLLIWLPILTIPILHTNSTIDANIHIRFVALSIYLLALCVFSFVLLKQNDFPFFPNDNIFILFILYAVASLIGCIISPFASGDSLFEWIKILLLPSFIFLITAVFSSKNNFINDLSKSIAILSFLIISYGIYQFAMLSSRIEITHYALYDIKTTFAHKNIFSEMLFVMLPFSLYCSLSLKNVWRWIGLSSAFFSVAFIVILMTRAVWIAFAVSVFALMLLHLFYSLRKKTISINKRVLLTILVFAGVILMSVVVYAYYDKEYTFVKQVSNIFNFKYGSTKERIILWKNSLKIFKEYPLFGVGMGNWQIEIMKYGSSGIVSENNVTFYQRPHNDFIWILTEQGIFAFFLYLSIIAVVYYNILKIIMHTQNNEERTFFYLLFLGFTGYFVFSVFSFPKERAEHLLFMSFTIASVLIYKRKILIAQNNLIGNKFSFSILLLIFFVGLFSLTVSAVRLRSEKYLAQAFKARQAGDWKTMITKLDLAESFFYHIDQVSTPLRWYRGLANFNLNNMQDALYDFKQAYSYNPYHVHVLNNLGTCYEMTGNHTEAIEYFQKAVDLSPTFDEARFNLCAAYYNSGDGKKAYLELRKINHEKMLEKYDHFLTIVLPSAMKTLRDTADADTKNQFDRILNTQEWINKIHFKSLEKNISIEKQLMLDIIYSVGIMDKDTLEANRLKNKYSILIKSS